MKKDFQTFNVNDDSTNEIGQLVSIGLIGFCIMLFVIITIGVLGETAVAGNQRGGYYPTAVPANQIYIDTDGGCIGCIWNR